MKIMTQRCTQPDVDQHMQSEMTIGPQAGKQEPSSSSCGSSYRATTKNRWLWKLNWNVLSMRRPVKRRTKTQHSSQCWHWMELNELHQFIVVEFSFVVSCGQVLDPAHKVWSRWRTWTLPGLHAGWLFCVFSFFSDWSSTQKNEKTMNGHRKQLIRS